MTERAIRKLKIKFLITAMLSFLLVMMAISGCIFAGNLVLTRFQIRNTLDFIAEHEGVLPENTGEHTFRRLKQSITEAVKDAQNVSPDNGIAGTLEEVFGIHAEFNSPDFFYATRYFAVIFDEAQEPTDVIVSHIASVDEEGAVEFAQYAMGRLFRFGSFDDFYYLVEDLDDGGSIVVCMDCANQIAVSQRLLFLALILIGFGMLISFVLLNLFSARLLKPEIKNAELQKQFITNASHELKTPLSVIKANTELMEMTTGENEWTRSTMRQIDRLTGLIGNLVQITRGQELEGHQDLKRIDLNKAITETVENLLPVAKQEGKAVTMELAEGLSMKAEEGQIRQLVALLFDNAVKYCDEAGSIEVRALRVRRTVKLTISNSFANGKDVDCEKFFERFYRADESHNTEKEGYGIGLSIAERICEDYNGSIGASWQNGRIQFTCSLVG